MIHKYCRKKIPEAILFLSDILLFKSTTERNKPRPKYSLQIASNISPAHCNNRSLPWQFQRGERREKECSVSLSHRTLEVLGRFSKDRASSNENEKARGKEQMPLPVVNFPLWHLSGRFFRSARKRRRHVNEGSFKVNSRCVKTHRSYIPRRLIF